MTAREDGEAGSPAEPAEVRLARLLDRLLTAGESAAAAGAWDRVVEIAEDILAVAPEHEWAVAMLERAQREQVLPEGQRALVSLLFSDIVGSTDLADVAEPETVLDVLKVYREAATDAVESLGGTVLQFQGDGIVACFGYPRVHEDDARRAVLAGVGLLERMSAAQPELRRRHGIDVPIRVAVHTGMVVVAPLPSGSADASNIVGASANLAARLQAEAEADTVVISDTTRQLVDADFDMASVGPRILKGISRPVDVFRVVGQRASGRGGRDALPQPLSLIGRGVPRERLHRMWDAVRAAAADNRPPDEPVVVVRGPAGIGKSRLAADLCEYVAATDGTVLPANCSPYHTNVALWPIARLIERRLGLDAGQAATERLAEVERRLEAAGLDTARVLPQLGPLLGFELDPAWARPEVDGLALRAESLDALVRWLARYASAQPSLLLVEDVHWADPSTIEVLGMVAADPVPGVMVVVTSRQPLSAEWAGRAAHLELGPLANHEAAMLIADTVADGDLSVEQQRIIIERGGGVPLFIQELARSTVTATSGESLPLRLQELLTARVRAPGIDLRVAQLAATLGPVFDEGLLRELAEGPVHGPLADMEAAGIIEPSGERRLGHFRFRHVLLRDAAYETQVLEARRLAHSRIARLLRATATGPGDLAIVAQHHDLAGDTAEGIPAYIAAAARAQAEASHSEARRLLDRALELLDATPLGEERDLIELNARLLRSVSVSSQFGYAYPDVLEDFQVAHGICRRYRDRPEILPAELGIWSHLFVGGDRGAASTVLEPLKQSAGAPEFAWFEPELKSSIGFDAIYGGELAEARGWLEDAWAIYLTRPAEARVSGFWPLPNDPVPVTAVGLACIAGLQGRTSDSAEWERLALATAEQIGFPRGPFSLAFVTTYLAWLRIVTGDAAGARSFGRRTIEIGNQHRFDYFTVLGRQYALFPEVDRPTDPVELEQCAVAMDLVGHGAFRPAYLGIVARNDAYLGHWDEALEHVDDGLACVIKSGELVHQPDLLRLRAEIIAAGRPDEVDEVVADLRAAVDSGLAQDSFVFALRAANDLARLSAADRPDDWRQVLESALHRFPDDSASPERRDALGLLGN